jgi:multidrug efflux pump subunit AcrA (membrane-fusion protein)
MRFLMPALAGLLLLAGCPGGSGGKAAGGAGGGGKGGGAPSGPPPVPVVVAPVELRDYAPAISLTGEVRATQRATLTAEVSGKVVAITARVGQSHKRSGPPLVQINPADYEAQVNVARSSLSQAQAALNQANNGARPEEIAGQQARVRQAEATLAQAQDNLRRQQQLFDSGVIPEAALVTARTQVDTAQGALDAQQEALNQLNAGTRKEEVQAAQARVKAAQSQLELAQLNLSKTAVTPSFDAKVVDMKVEEGQFVGPGTPLAEVVSDAPGEAWFNVGQDRVAQVHQGDEVEIRTDAIPDGVFKGSVIAISSAADPTTRQFPVRVALSDRALLPGMAVRGRILLGELKPTLMASEDAAFSSKLGLVVYRMIAAAPGGAPPAEGAAGAGGAGAAGGGPGGAQPPLPTVETVPVETGERIDNLVVITKGDLKPGDMLVTRGKEGLYPGAHIVPTNLMGGDKAGGDKAAAGGKPPAEGGAAVDGAAPGGAAETPPAGGAATPGSGNGSSGAGTPPSAGEGSSPGAQSGK